MMIIYGDYRDLNCVGDYDTSGPTNIPLKEKEELRPIWEKFIGGKLNLKKGRIKDDDYLSLPKIFIHHSVYESNDYTTYSLVKPTSCGGKVYVEHCKGFENKFIDREQGVIVLEKTSAHAKIPTSLKDNREKEVAYHKAALKRFASGPVVDIELNEADQRDIVRSWGVAAQYHVDEIDRWENKTTMRWFY